LPYIIGSVDNLRVIPWRANSVKGAKVNINIDKISTDYIKKEYLQNISLDEFIHKYCISKNGYINGKLSKQWFINRNSLKFYYEIMERTYYLENIVPIPKRVLLIYYGADRSKEYITGANNIRNLLSPTIDYVEISGHCDEDFNKHLLCFDKKINRYRLKSSLTKKSCNKKGLLYLFYKYIKPDRKVVKIMCSKFNDYPERE